MQLHLETTTKALVDEISEIVRDKNQNLNLYVAKFLRSNMNFHKKANQQFQTLSSIDTEGHKTYQGIYAAGTSDFHLHKLAYLSQNPGTAANNDGYDDVETKPKKEEEKPQQEFDYSIAAAGGPDDYQNRNYGQQPQQDQNRL